MKIAGAYCAYDRQAALSNFQVLTFGLDFYCFRSMSNSVTEIHKCAFELCTFFCIEPGRLLIAISAIHFVVEP